MKKIIGVLLLLATMTATADEIVQKFKSPSFSGQGTSAHYLTVENQEKTRRAQIQDDIESALKAAEREADNTTLAKFPDLTFLESIQAFLGISLSCDR